MKKEEYDTEMKRKKAHLHSIFKWAIVPPLFIISAGTTFALIVFVISQFGFFGLLAILAILSFAYWKLI